MVAMPEPAPGGATLLLPLPRRVRRRVRETADTFTLAIEAGDDTVAFRPGQFNMLYVFGTGEVPISVSGDPREPGILMHTTRAVGAVTRPLAKLAAGATVGVRGPFGTPWPLDAATGKDVVLVAGGIGLAPLRPLLYEIAARRHDFGRVVLLYGARGPGDLLFVRQLERWRDAADVTFAVSVDRASPGWTGHVGVVTTLLSAVDFAPGHTVAFVCGPEIMMRFAADALRRRGVDEPCIFVSMERNMKCATGLCGHCQFGPAFVCKDGPVFAWPRVQALLSVREA
jgi:NAD(P)H-flavin reductase